MFSPYHTSGFYCASLTKGVLSVLILSAVAFNIPLTSYRSWFRIASISLVELDSYRWLLKLLGSRLVFLDPKDVFCAGILLYHFRLFERRYGSMKYANCLFGTFVLSIVLEVACIYGFYSLGVILSSIPTGPWGIVFALLVPYFCDIPRVIATHIWGVPVTGKSITYIVALQMLSNSLESVTLATCGLVSGMLYRQNFLKVQQWLRIPSVVGVAVRHTVGRLFYTPCPNSLKQPIGATIEIQRQQQIEMIEQQLAQRHRAAMNQFGFGLFQNQPAQNVPEPSEEQVQRLVEMGFTRDSVLDALHMSNNDSNAATSILLRQ